MKKILFILVVALCFANKGFAQCESLITDTLVKKAGNNAVCLKEFRAKLKKGTINEPVPTVVFQVLLNKAVHYRFCVFNDNSVYKGKGIMELYTDNKLVQSTFDKKNNKNYPAFDFICRKTQIYTVYMSFENGEEGCAVGLLCQIK